MFLTKESVLEISNSLSFTNVPAAAQVNYAGFSRTYAKSIASSRQIYFNNLFYLDLFYRNNIFNGI